MGVSDTGKVNRRGLERLLLLTGILVLAAVLIWLAFGDMFPTLLRLLRRGDAEAIEAYIERNGFWRGALAVVLLSALQVFSVVFPGLAIQIAAGVMFGGPRAFLMCYTGFVLGNVLVFLLARRMRGHVKELVRIDRRDSWIREKMRSANPAFVVAICDLLPGLPNGIVPYVASRSKISTRDYFLAVAGSSWIQILLNCAAGGFLQDGEFFYMALTIAVQLVIFAVVILKRKWIIARIPGGRTETEK